MPLKLPAPDFGTDEHAGPKSVMADAEPDGMAEEGDDAAAFGAEPDVPDVPDAPPELPHAAVPRARPVTTTEAARMRFFTVSPLIVAVTSMPSVR
jgi:hypothetical protein